MTRDALIIELEAYQGEAEEQGLPASIVQLLRNEPRCFYRDCCLPGHITGSGLLMNAVGDKILLNHHKIMNRWVGFGGHADGDEDIARVAQREVIEESGIEQVQFAFQGIWDIDIHPIPFNAKKNEPAHHHFDISYLFQVTGVADFVLSDESHNLRWCSLAEAAELSPQGQDLHMDRMFRKWQRYVAAKGLG